MRAANAIKLQTLGASLLLNFSKLVCCGATEQCTLSIARSSIATTALRWLQLHQHRQEQELGDVNEFFTTCFHRKNISVSNPNEQLPEMCQNMMKYRIHHVIMDRE